MIRYDFIISVHHLNQRPLRSILFQWNADNADGMIRYDFIISDHHLNQRHQRSIIKKLSINIKNKNL